jgi:hypothetical protein
MDDFTMDDECQLCSRRISKLVFSGLTGADTIYCWVSRQIQPLQYRLALMCQYSRIDDPQRYTKEPVAEHPVATVRHGVRGSGGHMRSLGKRVISRHPSLALRGHLETITESTATIKLPDRK